MNVTGRSILVTLVSTAVLAAGAGGASASTFFVNGTIGNDGNPCTDPLAQCKTIGAAVLKARNAPEASTIQVAPGVYQEAEKALEINKAADEGLAIVGSGSGAGGTEILGLPKEEQAAVEFGVIGGSARLAHVVVVSPPEDAEPAIRTSESTVLEDVSVFMQGAGSAAGVQVNQPGSLSWTAGAVQMEAGTTGTGISANLAPMALSGVAVTVAPGSEAEGIFGQFAPLTLTNSSINVLGAKGGPAILSNVAPLSFNGVAVNQSGPGNGIVSILPPSATYTSVGVNMSEAGSEATGLFQEHGSATLANVSVGGTWKGSAAVLSGSSYTILDSHLIAGPESKVEVASFTGTNEGAGLFVQRSVIQGSQTGIATAAVTNGNATFDSSAVLGSRTAVTLSNNTARPKEITVAASTVDAGVVGAADEKDHAIGVASASAAAATATAVGSILVEPQRAVNEHAIVACVDTDAPNQAQAQTATLGAINCATGLSGNTTTAPAALFAAPTVGLSLAPATAAIDTLPAGAISLPFGQVSSATDLVGAPRVLDGNGDCVAVQDRGALELQGHAAPCPPVKGVISGLTLSPSSFRAAPRGATLAKARFGTSIKYLDSQAATTTFTVFSAQGGRKQHGSCRKPSRANRKGKRCTRYVSRGVFIHKDLVGANSLRFTGRLHRHKLAKGVYRLQAIPRNAAGAGAVVNRSFRIR